MEDILPTPSGHLRPVSVDRHHHALVTWSAGHMVPGATVCPSSTTRPEFIHLRAVDVPCDSQHPESCRIYADSEACMERLPRYLRASSHAICCDSRHEYLCVKYSCQLFQSG